ncbi:MAG: hypothetical protein RLZZ385_2211 [Pseudomonadota bacterium]|jgi:riboflavin kinase/FMN adenylyltransferase
MRVITAPEEFRQIANRCAVTIGKFDGVHLGHQAILRQLLDKAAQLACPAVVILIEPHPEEFFASSPEACPPRLTTLQEKIELLAAQHIDVVFQLRFDRQLSQLSAEQYVEEILVRGLGVAALIIGNDFRFGQGRRGDFTLLQSLGRRHGFEVLETAGCEVDRQRVSSTLIREQLALGDFERVEKLLGRPYSISGEVIRGRQLGADLGFPTCNIRLHRQRIPLHGVFACEARWRDQRLRAAVNIGYRPTVSDSGEALLEAHILDFNEDLYGETLHIVFRSMIRDEQKFPDLAALQRQIAADVARVREFFQA